MYLVDAADLEPKQEAVEPVIPAQPFCTICLADFRSPLHCEGGCYAKRQDGRYREATSAPIQVAVTSVEGGDELVCPFQKCGTDSMVQESSSGMPNGCVFEQDVTAWLGSLIMAAEGPKYRRGGISGPSVNFW